MSKTLFKSTTTIAGMTLISRVFGFIRDIVLAQFFGATGSFDAFLVAFKIPNFMRRLFAEGSFSQAFVPVLSEYQKQKTPAEMRDFLNAMSGTLGLVLVGVTILGEIFTPWIVRVFAAGFASDGPRFQLAVTLLRITFPYLLLISLTAFSGAILNTHNRFWVAAFTPVFLNIALIAACFYLVPHMATPVIGLAWGVFIAGVIQLLFQWPFLKKMRLLPKPYVNFRDSGVKQVLKLMVPALFGVSVSQINLLVDTMFASFLTVGSISWLYYSDRLMEFPLGVFGVAISTVILPYLSRQHASQSDNDFALTLDWALRWVLLIGIPAGVSLALLAGPLLSTLFQHSAVFGPESVRMAEKSLRMFALGILPFMLVKILASAFYAKKNMRTPVRVGIIALFANMGLNVLLIWPLAHAGIALATSLASLVNAGLLFYFLKRDNLYKAREGWLYFAFRLLLANLLLSVWLWFGAGDLNQWIEQTTMWRLIHLLFLLGSAILVYLSGLWLAGVRPNHLLIREQPLSYES